MSDTSIRQSLAREAREAQARREEAPGKMFRSRGSSAASNVYTLRMPADRLAELRDLAENQHEQPSVLMRRWVLERLDSERVHQSDIADVRQMLSRALHKLDHLVEDDAVAS